MTTIIDYILDLFRSPDLAGAFIADPEQALRDAGLPNVTAAQLQAVAATAAPAGIALGGGDPVLGLQRAVADHHSLANSFAPMYAPQRTFAPETDIASHNRTNAEFLSPDQSSGANSQVGGFNLGFGDITFGNKTSNTATDGGVVVDGDNAGTVTTGNGNVVGDENVTGKDIVVGDDNITGEGNVVGDDNITDNSKVDVETGNHSPVIVGDENEVEDNSQTAGDDIISDNDAPVLNDVDTSGGNGGGSVAGGGFLGGGSSSGGDGGNGGGIVIVDNSGVIDNSADETVVDNSVDNSTDNSVGIETDIDTTVETNVDAGLF
ncbi:IniB N-terminal domain-containing protein [Mycolicibacterium bacteremicum]|uniref:IniB N-terminal domain-containing protein n=1 Tax=Mycolicibacterium bacteremicum TaxID=564198 RepID=UPI0026EC594B|nr:IniB N-terminal domain-containing protein [Mycolicibacterium bacteremicum]